MLVTELKVSGYKTLRDVTWHPGRLNVVIGPNASGKSNLLRLLSLLSDSADGELYEHVLNDGGIGSVVWNSTSKAFGADVCFTADPNRPLNDYSHVVYKLVVTRVGETASYIVSGEAVSEYDDSGKLIYMPLEQLDGNGFLTPDAGLSPLNVKSEKSVESLLSQLKGLSLEMAGPEVRSISEQLPDWSIHHDFHSETNAEIRRPVVARHDERLDPDGQNLASVLHTYYENDADFQENIDQAMTAAFGDEYRSLAFPPAGSQNIELCVRWRSIKRPQPASTLSDGTLRFLFLITALSLPKPPSLIAIDEPETGLHPMMMRIVAEYAENAALKSQVIFTTHSTAFLNGFSKDEPPTVTVMDLVDGESRMRVVDPETLGRWLKDYSLGQLYQSHELEQMPGLEEAA